MFGRKGTGATTHKSDLTGWIKANWIPITLVLIFVLALFVRSAFALEPSVNNSPIEGNFVVSGGSDSYYHKRIIDSIAEDHTHLVEDPMLNYPDEGQLNPRPPFWQWTVVMGGYGLSPIAGSVDTGIWYSFIFSTAFWGALTVIPLYFIGRSMFGKKVGLAAAFLLAIEAGHIERTVLTNADHDSFAMFFTVLGFYFFLRALATAREERWVENWFKPSSLKSGISEMIKNNRASFLYAMMAGVSLAGVALAWKGFSYIVLILALFALAQVLVNRFRNADSTTVTTIFGITSLGLLIVASPWYIFMGQTGTWLDVPFMVAIAVIIAGIVFSVTRDLPWTLVLPSLAIAAIVGAVMMILVTPDLWESIVGGQGFLAKSKLYTTIAEAQAAPFSKFVLSFGAFTFFLAFAGVIWAAITYPKHIKSDYLFIVVWVAATLYMATTQARFLFNASPSFALMSGWVLIILIQKMDFKGMMKNIRYSGGGLKGIRKAIKFPQIVGVLFLAFMIVIPNVWYAVDAGIPYESKPEYDLAVYNTMPSFLQPETYDEENGSIWYFGAFGYSMPVKSSTWQTTSYWPDAWEYLAEQDTDLPEADRPAFVSWWDYGFEAIQEGKHPAVSDNFQNGFQFTGNFLMSQGEDEAIALFIVRLIENIRGTEFTPGVREVLQKHMGVNETELMEDIAFNPDDYVDDVLNNPDRFGPRTPDVNELTPVNMKYTYLKTLIVENIPDSNGLVDLYRDIRAATGDSIRYFAVDSRLFPFSAQNTGIFYAPAHLSDHRVTTGNSRIPYDFFEIKIVTDKGEFSVDDDIPQDAIVEDYTIEYKDMFYNSMLYRCYIGYTAEEAGQGTGIPVVQSQNLDILPAWGMKNFRVVYRTSYWNPNDDYENHSKSWEAVSIDEAQEHAEAEEGILLPSYAGVYHGVVFIEYYDGAFLNGTITTDEGDPAPHVLVTIRDEYGIPHDYGYTDANGDYSILAPFGDLNMTVSTGSSFNPFTMVEKDILIYKNVTVSDAQSMREEIDEDGDGVWDFIIINDFEISTSGVTGNVFLDVDDDDTLSQDVDDVFANAEVVLENTTFNITFSTTTDVDGAFEFNNVVPGVYDLRASENGDVLGELSISVSNSDVSQDIMQTPGIVNGIVAMSDGTPVPLALVNLSTSDGEEIGTVYADDNGAFSFDKLISGSYAIEASSAGYFQKPHEFVLGQNITLWRNLTLSTAMPVTGIIRDGGMPVPNATVRLLDTTDFVGWSTTTNALGEYSITVPRSMYEISCKYIEDAGTKFALEIYDPIVDGGSKDLTLVSAPKMTGTTSLSDGNLSAVLLTFAQGEKVIRTSSNSEGEYVVDLLPGNWTLHAQTQKEAVGYSTLQSMSINASSTVDITLSVAEKYEVESRLETDTGDGGPLPWATLIVRSTSSPTLETRAVSNSVGQHTFFLPDDDYSLTIQAFGYEESAPTGIVANVSTEIMMPYEIVNVTGVLATAGGDPENARVVFTSAIGNESAVYPAGSGLYQIDLVPGVYDMHVEYAFDANTRYLAEDELRLEPGDASVSFDITAIRAYQINGSFGNYQSADGNISVETYDVDGNFLGSEESTAPNGEFLFFSPVGDSYVMLVNEAKSRIYATTLSVSGPQQFDVNLTNTATFSGELRDALNNAYEIPIPITFEDEANGGKVIVSSDDSWEYSFVAVSGRQYTISVDHVPGSLIDGTYSTLSYNALGITPGPRDLDLTATPLEADVEGQTSVGVTPTSAQVDLYAQELPAMDGSTISNATGQYSVPLTPGDYLVHVTDSLSTALVPFNVPVDAVLQTTPVPLDITMSGGYSLSGRIYYNNISNATKYVGNTSLVFSTSEGELTLETQPDGRYDVVLPEGEYNLSIGTTETEFGILNTYSGEANVTLNATRVTDLKLDIVSLYKLSGSVFGDNITMNPGDEETFTLTISNDGNVDDNIEFITEPAGWNITLSPSEVDIPFNGEINVTATVIAPEDARSDHAPVKVTAKSVNRVSATAAITIDIHVPQTYGLELMEINQSRGWDGTNYLREFELNNSGNGPDNFTLTITNLEELEDAGWNVTLGGAGTPTYDSLGVPTYFMNDTSNNVTVTMLASKTGDASDPIGVDVAVDSNNTAEKTVTVNLAQPDLSVDDLDASGEFVSEVDDGQTALITFVILLGLLIAIMILFGRPKKGRRS